MLQVVFVTRLCCLVCNSRVLLCFLGVLSSTSLLASSLPRRALFVIGNGLRSSHPRQVHVLHACFVFSSFSSAITSFPCSFHTVYINTILKEGNRCVSGSLACLPGFVCPCLWACPGPPPPWLMVLHGIALAGVFAIDQAGRPAFAVLAVLVPPGPRSLPGPGLAWQRLGC